jgi:hypothetical protein
MRWYIRLFLVRTLAFLFLAVSLPAQDWIRTVVELPYATEDGRPVPGRDGKLAVGKDGKPVAYEVELSLPADIRVVRGILIGGTTFTSNAPVRAALAEKSMGLLNYLKTPDGLFSYATCDSGARLQRDLKILAEKVGHPEVAFAPLMTIGYSTSGITCRNYAYWNPERIIGVMHLKSGNLQAYIQDMHATLAGVPFLAVNGECEQYGPDGGDLGAGLRAIYSLDPVDKKKNNQTQWVMMRMQMIERRRRNEDNLMSLLVQHTRGNSKDHTEQDPAFYPVLAQFIRSAADARIPKGDPDGKTPVKCVPLTAKEGWLSDADIKAPKFAPAPYADYRGDRTVAFWHLDKAMADAVTAYHAKTPWAFPDPTAGLPPEERFRVGESILRDTIDLPVAAPGREGR